MHYLHIIANAYSGYFRYLLHEVLHPGLHNYFWYLTLLSAVVYGFEILFPWRTAQPRVRRDFWLDGFYMFFNFFLFSLIGFNAASNVVVALWDDLLGLLGLRNAVALQVRTWPAWCQLGLLFVVKDFIQWNTHRLLHRVPWLWEFHKVHHSVQQMGFAAHLRYHWFENVAYKAIQYVPLSLIGFGVTDFFVVDAFTTAIGHLNHANVRLTWGPLRYVLNSPAMHIWHHAQEIPQGSYGQNFGITLSAWDYLFGTARVPADGRDIALGFPGIESFPRTLLGQLTYPWSAQRGRHAIGSGPESA